ncbi:Rne/Rng family ribonuclease [Alkalibaculum sporogenes]|nr:Rne/Rng family ribonuclease [Alkalibaculum sporogenes]
MNRIIMDSIFGQVRIAITHEDKLVHFFLERETNWNNYGDIYMGRIEQIKPGIQAAFVNIGSEKNGLLHLEDIIPNEDNKPIDKLVKKGQELLVQIKKEAIAEKGARLTTKFSISGHYLVLLPYENRIFTSKKISNKEEKNRITTGINEVKDGNYGVIIRTEAMGIDLDIIKKELNYLINRWEKINHSEIAPKLMYNDSTTVVKILRDFYTQQIDEIIVNDMDIINELQEYLAIYSYQDIEKIKYVDKNNLLELYHIEKKTMQLFDRKVWLKSGGYIVIDFTEACTVIDINSGKFTGKKNMDETILKINLEASEVIADQIRLRNISGIIIIDYINIKMKEEQHIIIKHLNKHLQKDKVKTKVYGFTELCILQMTRQQQGKSLSMLQSEHCRLCGGTGLIPNQEALFYRCLASIERNKDVLEGDTIIIKVNPYIKKLIDEIEMKNEKFTFIQMIKDFYKKKSIIEEDEFLEIDEMKVLSCVDRHLGSN